MFSFADFTNWSLETKWAYHLLEIGITIPVDNVFLILTSGKTDLQSLSNLWVKSERPI